MKFFNQFIETKFRHYLKKYCKYVLQIFPKKEFKRQILKFGWILLSVESATQMKKPCYDAYVDLMDLFWP